MTDDNNDTRKVFKENGTCSRIFFFLLNREFGHLKETEESAMDPFAGGIMQQGYQCGMLWGAAIAAGAEAYRISNGHGNVINNNHAANDGHATNDGLAIGRAITATQHVMESFKGCFGSAECYDITDTNFSKKISMVKFLIFKARSCFKYAEQWAPKAIESAKEGLSCDPGDLTGHSMSCASELARKMGASEEEITMVAGFAGGLGLSGSGCGVLAAAIWMQSIAWAKENPAKSPYNNPKAKETLALFMKTTDYELECSKIAGQRFKTIAEHTEYVRNGGCEKLIDVMAKGVGIGEYFV